MKNNDTNDNDLFNKSIGTLFPVSEEKTRANWKKKEIYKTGIN